MTRFLTIFVIGVAVVVCLGDVASAIDVKPSADTGKAKVAAPAGQPPAKSFQTAPVKRERGLLDTLKRQVRESKRTSGQQYDNYLDADGDGVDDRLARRAKIKEEPRKESPARAAPEQKSKSKKSVRRVAPKEKP